MLPVPIPLRFHGQNIRASLIPCALGKLDSLNDLDVVAFQELIDPISTNTILTRMYDLGWKYVSNKLRPTYHFPCTKLGGGGVVILSKYPIVKEAYHIFENACDGYDCLSAKGVVYCRVIKANTVFNIISTHLQAWDTKHAQDIRIKQVMQIHNFIKILHIPKNEPMILVGDFNVDYHNTLDSEFLYKIMKFQKVKLSPSTYKFSVDPFNNVFVGNDDINMYTSNMFPNGCAKEYYKSMKCICCPHVLLDHVAYSIDHLNPIQSSMTIQRLKTNRKIQVQLNFGTKICTNDLSDHYPVIGVFTFEKKKHILRCKIHTHTHNHTYEHTQYNQVDNIRKLFTFVSTIFVTTSILISFMLRIKS